MEHPDKKENTWVDPETLEWYNEWTSNKDRDNLRYPMPGIGIKAQIDQASIS